MSDGEAILIFVLFTLGLIVALWLAHFACQAGLGGYCA